MSKQKVFIVLTHKHSLKSKTNDEWEVHETVQFLNQLRNKHYEYASAIGDYVNGKMLIGSKVGMSEYNNFENYVRKKYKEQMDELDKMYGSLRIRENSSEIIKDEFGNTRLKTVFDV